LKGKKNRCSKKKLYEIRIGLSATEIRVEACLLIQKNRSEV